MSHMFNQVQARIFKQSYRARLQYPICIIALYCVWIKVVELFFIYILYVIHISAYMDMDMLLMNSLVWKVFYYVYS